MGRTRTLASSWRRTSGRVACPAISLLSSSESPYPCLLAATKSWKISKSTMCSAVWSVPGASAEDLDSNWYSGQSSMFGNTAREYGKVSPRFELECGHRRLANHCLNLNGLLQHSLYLLFFFSSIKWSWAWAQQQKRFTGTLRTRATGRAYSERSSSLTLSEDDIEGMDGKDTLSKIESVYQRGDPDDTPNSVTYTIRHFTYHASVIWASTEYMEGLETEWILPKDCPCSSTRTDSTSSNRKSLRTIQFHRAASNLWRYWCVRSWIAIVWRKISTASTFSTHIDNYVSHW